MTNDEILDIAEGIEGGHHFYAAVADELLIDFARAIIAKARAEMHVVAVARLAPGPRSVLTVEYIEDKRTHVFADPRIVQGGVPLAILPPAED